MVCNLKKNIYFHQIHSPGTSGNNRQEEANLPVIKSVKNKSSKKSSSEKHQRRDDLRLTRMMLIIFCCFLLCFLPLMVVNVADDEVCTCFVFFSLVMRDVITYTCTTPSSFSLKLIVIDGFF